MTLAIQKFYNKHKNESEINRVIDFLLSEYPLKKSINFSFIQALEKTEKWELSRKSEVPNEYLSGEVELIHSFPNKLNLVRLIDQDSKNWEGLKMGHCAGNFVSHDTIFSLRDENYNPHCTIEISKNKINQIKGKRNGAINNKYVDTIISCLEILSQRYNIRNITSLDIKNIGYINISLIEREFFSKFFLGSKIITINNSFYLSFNEKLTLKKNFSSFNFSAFRKIVKYRLCDEAAHLMISNGLDFNDPAVGPYILHTVLDCRDIKTIKLIFSSGYRFSNQDYDFIEGFLNEIELSAFKYLIQEKIIPLNLRFGYSKNTIIESLAYHDNLEKIDFLLSYGCSFCKDRPKELIEAVRSKNLRMIRFLIDKGSNIEKQQSLCISHSIQHGDFKTLEFLLNNGFSYEKVDNKIINKLNNYLKIHLLLRERKIKN
tara:strand:+ start:2034 stop:3326 length:1293 start_codon:yes stop_codon:yes gene_type:complete